MEVWKPDLKSIWQTWLDVQAQYICAATANTCPYATAGFHDGPVFRAHVVGIHCTVLEGTLGIWKPTPPAISLLPEAHFHSDAITMWTACRAVKIMFQTRTRLSAGTTQARVWLQPSADLWLSIKS